MNDCRTCKYAGNNADDRCRGCWKDGVWRRREAADLEGNTVKSFEAGWNIGYMRGLEDGKAIANPKWIPVEEKLPPKCTYIPEHTEYVLVFRNGGDIDLAYYSDYTDMWHGNFETYDHVIAWMPLPEPYKPKEETP